jgi:hypothetical protein
MMPASFRGATLGYDESGVQGFSIQAVTPIPCARHSISDKHFAECPYRSPDLKELPIDWCPRTRAQNRT